ncbi:hypothetical protein [Streptomyces sp. NBC_01429]|uniref:hypothetical protein n=1 Tax=Streptomyces sp. NBC_01429 TaxID=2903862 RepID=UPI002E289803|nr:hypothetical protein [Streptomyces sp. NBC_01429]
MAARIRDAQGQLLEDAVPFTPVDPASALGLDARPTRTAPGRLTPLLTSPAACEARGGART